MSGDRLDRILEASPSGQPLADRYDRWAADYDDDNRTWGWRGPDEVAAAFRRHGDDSVAGIVLDAGCGTGAVGVALRERGVAASLIGADISSGMLAEAAGRGSYTHLLQCSLDRIPLVDHAVSAVVSSGVFTHGHVGPEALVELCRVTAPGGTVSITRRLDLVERYRPTAERLVAAGRWELIETTDPEPFHPGRDGSGDAPVLQSVLTWRVGRG